jgi:hypothetical protein
VNLSEPISNPRAILAWVVGLSTLLRLWFGRTFFGYHTGDDVEILQQGFMRALGTDYVPWEIRNLFISDLLVAPVVSLVSVLGADSTRTLCWLATLGFVILGSLNITLVFLLARRWLDSEWAASLAAALYAFHWLPLGYGSTVYPRTASTTCVLVAIVLLDRIRPAALGAASAGAMIGVAFAVRYSEAIFLFPIVAMLVTAQGTVARKARLTLALGAGFSAAAAVTVGLWDLMTWGRGFSSLMEFADYTLVEKQSSAMVRDEPWYWYLWRLPKWLPLTVIPFFFGPGAARRLRGPLLFSVLPVLALSFIHYKNMRYLQGVVPFLAIGVAGGACAWWLAGRRRAVVVLLVLSVFFGVSVPTFVAKKSMAAVLAAESMAADPGVSVVALSQTWAYGEDLFLGDDTEVRELGPYPDTAEFQRMVPGSDRVALYRDRLEELPRLEHWLRERGFERIAVFEWGWSRPVVVFSRTLPPPPFLE